MYAPRTRAVRRPLPLRERVGVRGPPRASAARWSRPRVSCGGLCPPHPHPGRARSARLGPPTRPRMFLLWGLRPHAPVRIGSRDTAPRAIASPPVRERGGEGSPRAGAAINASRGLRGRGSGAPRPRALTARWGRAFNGKAGAGVAQLVEHLPSKQKVAGSRPVPRSTHPPASAGSASEVGVAVPGS